MLGVRLRSRRCVLAGDGLGFVFDGRLLWEQWGRRGGGGLGLCLLRGLERGG